MTMSSSQTFTSGQVLTADQLTKHVTEATPTALTASCDVDGFDLTDADEIEFRNAAANASAAGRLRRNANDLSWGAGGTAGRLFYAGGTDVPVADGGTALSSGTSGGVLAFTATGTIASSAALTLNGVVIGGGAGAAPSSTASGTANQAFRVPAAGGAPAFGTIATDGLADDAITDAKLRNSAAASLIGRSAATSGDPADISSAADGEVMRRAAGILGWGTIATAGIADDAVTDAKLRNSAAASLIGRSAATVGDPADISSAADGEVMRRAAGVLGWGTVATAGIADDAVTYAKIQNISATDRLLGRSTAGAGDTEEIVCTASGRALIDDASAAAQRTTLGVGTGDTPTLTGLITTGQAAHRLDPFGTLAGNTGEVRFLELAANGTNYVGFKSPDTLAANVIWTLPSADGSNTQVLQTNGSGVLSFATLSSTGFTAVNTSFTNAAGNVAVTGAGFAPRALIMFVNNSLDIGQHSDGWASSTTARLMHSRRDATTFARSTTLVYSAGDSTDRLEGDLVSLDTDGATFGRTQIGAGKGVDVSILFFD